MTLIAVTTIAVMQGSANLLAQVAEPALRALALAGAAGVGLRVFRVKATAVRLFAWTAVLYGALAMPLLGWMLPPLAVPAPAFVAGLFGQDVAVAGSQPLRRRIALSSSGAQEYSPERGRRKAPAPVDGITFSSADQASPASAIPHTTEENGFIAPLEALRHQKSSLEQLFAGWISSGLGAGAAWIYLVVVLVLLTRVVVGIEFSRRLLRAAHEIHDPRATRRLASRADAAGLMFLPETAESELISVPVTLGALRSTILLPQEWREWDDAKLDAVLAHEVAHVARRDGLTQRLSLLHRAIFWFSPLAWWLDRHLADLAEQASDEAALSFGADRKDYARTLLGFFEALHAAPGRVWWQGVSIAKAGQAEQRVERILSWKGAVAMSMKKSIAVAVLTLAAPVIYLAAAVHPASPIPPGAEFAQAQASTPPAPSAAPESVPAAPP